MPLELAALSSERLKRLDPKQTVFFFAVGPLEDHGPHLPLGQDLSEAAWLCRAAAERLEAEKPGWTGVLMPAAPLGVEGETAETVIKVRAHVLRDWLVDACRSLSRAGFLHYVCFSGQLGPRQLTAIEDAGKSVSGVWMRLLRPGPRPTLVSADSAAVSIAEVKRAPFWPDPLEHGGKRDTSVALFLNAASVDSIYNGLPAREPDGAVVSRALSRVNRSLNGYWGDPAKADAEYGRKALQDRLDSVFPKLQAVWGGANGNMLFRSWYSILPPNKSFFKSWLIAFLIIGIFGAMMIVDWLS